MWSISSWLLILTLVSCTHRSWLVPNIQRPNLASLYCRVEHSLVTKELMCTSLDSDWKGPFYDNFFTWSQNWTREFWLQNANSTSELSHPSPSQTIWLCHWPFFSCSLWWFIFAGNKLSPFSATPLHFWKREQQQQSIQPTKRTTNTNGWKRKRGRSNIV